MQVVIRRDRRPSLGGDLLLAVCLSVQTTPCHRGQASHERMFGFRARSSGYPRPGHTGPPPQEEKVHCPGCGIISPHPMSAKQTAMPVYDRFYYLFYMDPDGKLEYARSDHWLRFFGYIAERISVDIQPASVLDAGCAMGMIVEGLRDRGIEAFGVDISEYALANVRADIQPYCTRASVTEALPRRYELIMCIETLEHLQPVEAERAVANLCAHTDDVIFSSTPSHFEETTHLNVRPPEYWAELFARYGLYRDVEYDPSTYIAPWAVRFRRRADPTARIVGDYERLVWRLSSENRGLRGLALERQADLARATDKVNEAQAEVASVRLELEQTRATTAWHVAHQMASIVNWLMPNGSRRRGIARWIRGRQMKVDRPDS
jgi:SAM-dependent methyltransferase